MAQGGAAQGYALFLQSGKLMFLVRSAGTATQVATLDTVTGSHTVVARLGPAGAMSLTLDGLPAVTAKAPGPLPQMPLDGLDVGSDQKGLVGPYGASNAFPGTVSSVVVDLDVEQAD